MLIPSLRVVEWLCRTATSMCLVHKPCQGSGRPVEAARPFEKHTCELVIVCDRWRRGIRYWSVWDGICCCGCRPGLRRVSWRLERLLCRYRRLFRTNHQHAGQASSRWTGHARRCIERENLARRPYDRLSVFAPIAPSQQHVGPSGYRHAASI